jgi:regulatory protein
MSTKEAYSYLVKLLSARDYSEHKLREKLKLKKFPANEIEDALNDIKARGYLREEIYTEARVKGFMNKSYSVNYIRQKMAQEHLTVSEESIQEIFDEHHVDEEDQIKKLLAKKLRSISDDKEEAYKEKQKAARFALSKGHNPGLVFKILKSSFNGQDIGENEY